MSLSQEGTARGAGSDKVQKTFWGLTSYSLQVKEKKPLKNWLALKRVLSFLRAGKPVSVKYCSQKGLTHSQEGTTCEDKKFHIALPACIHLAVPIHTQVSNYFLYKLLLFLSMSLPTCSLVLVGLFTVCQLTKSRQCKVQSHFSSFRNCFPQKITGKSEKPLAGKANVRPKCHTFLIIPLRPIVETYM